MLDASDYVAPQPDERTRRIDRVLLHPLWGTITFFAVMFYFFQVLFTAAAPLRDGIGSALTWLGGQVAGHVGNPVLRGLLGQGILGGVGTVLQFIPQIVLLFCLLAFLESVGYMSRAAFLMDRVMAKTGLEGRAFVAMLSSFACAIPGIMATRTLPSSRDRIATIVTAPLMTCSARLPVYTLLVGLLVAPQTRWGGLSAQGVTMFLLYLGGGLSALVAALAVKSTILRGDLLPFTMELPPYRLPSAKAMLAAMWSAARVFLRKAGTIILATSLVLWALLNLPVREAQTRGMSSDRCHRVRDESQLCRRPRPLCRTGVFAAGLRLAHRYRTGRLAVGPRGLCLDAGPGRCRDGSRSSAASACHHDRRPGQANLHRTHRDCADGVFHVRAAVHVDDRGDATGNQHLAMARLRLRLHVRSRLGDGVRFPLDRDRAGRMIPIHATATANPQQLRWVVAADRLPARGAVRRAPGRLGELLADGVIDQIHVRPADVVITLHSGHSWRDWGDDVRAALCEALLEPDGWNVDAADDTAELAAIAAELLSGPIGALAESHGGSIELVSIEGDIVNVRLSGACHGCPAAAGTLYDTLQRELRRRSGRDVKVNSETSSAAMPLGRKLLSLIVR